MNELVKSNLYLIHIDDELYHHGIKGMKWGVRRYQNPDGSLTEEGKKRKRKRLIAAGAIVAGVAALTIGAIAGGKAARKLNAGRKYMANTNWRNVTMSNISDAKSPIDISNIRNMNSGKYGLARTTGLKSQGKMPWSKSPEAPWSKAGQGSPWSRSASPETGKWFNSPGNTRYDRGDIWGTAKRGKYSFTMTGKKSSGGGKYGLARTTGLKSQGKMPWSKSPEAPWSKAGQGSPWSRSASPETGKWFESHKTTVEGIGRNFKQPLATSKDTLRYYKNRMAKDLGIGLAGTAAAGAVAAGASAYDKKRKGKKKKQS